MNKERLTKWDCLVKYIVPESEIEKMVNSLGEVYYGGNAIHKLADYEDMRLSPVQLDELKLVGKKSIAILKDVLVTLKRMCNHCVDIDCENCWSNEICEKIIKLFDCIKINKRSYLYEY